MAHIQLKKEWGISENLATPESAYLRRREFLKGTVLTASATAGALYGCGPAIPAKTLPEIIWSELDKTIYPAKRNLTYELDRPLTAESIASTYNNFYELYSTESRFYYLSLIKTDDKWHIHGLWPQYDKKTYPKFCRNIPFDITKLNSIINNLHDNWYSNKDKDSLFWEHEWNKHGTCMFQMNEPQIFYQLYP